MKKFEYVCKITPMNGELKLCALSRIINSEDLCDITKAIRLQCGPCKHGNRIRTDLIQFNRSVFRTFNRRNKIKDEYTIEIWVHRWDNQLDTTQIFEQ